LRSGGGTRTHNKRLNRPVLCRLSYPGIVDERSSAGACAVATVRNASLMEVRSAMACELLEPNSGD
jgi:hypothetical protein